jgi:hypothetical protein
MVGITIAGRREPVPGKLPSGSHHERGGQEEESCSFRIEPPRPLRSFPVKEEFAAGGSVGHTLPSESDGEPSADLMPGKDRCELHSPLRRRSIHHRASVDERIDSRANCAEDDGASERTHRPIPASDCAIAVGAIYVSRADIAFRGIRAPDGTNRRTYQRPIPQRIPTSRHPPDVAHRDFTDLTIDHQRNRRL